VVLVLWFGV
jgi:hypothetical protein